jgi:hypothetical protein
VEYRDPDIVYKYRKFDNYGFRIFWDRQIYFADIGSLNDPLDCQVDIDFQLHELAEVSGCQSLRKKFDQLRNLKTLCIENGSATSIQKEVNRRVRELGVFCTSARATEALMWAHYADGHAGFCIGFDGQFFAELRSLQDEYLGFGPVDYVPEPNFREDFEKASSDLDLCLAKGKMWGREEDAEYAESLIIRLITSKALDWKYENEYRCFRRSPSLVNYRPSNVKQVVFGSRSNPMNRFVVKTLLSSPEWAHVEFKVAEFRQGSFGMTLRDL